MSNAEIAAEPCLATDRSAKRGVLVVGNYRPTLSVVRSLARAGYSVAVAREPWTSFAERSKAAKEAVDLPAVEDERAFVGAIGAFLRRRPDIRFVFPVRGLALMHLSRRRDELPPGVVVAAPPARLVELCDDKLAMLRLAEEIGLPQPPHALVEDYGALRREARAVGFPLVVKPAVAELKLFGEKAVICETEAALERALPGWPEGHASLLLQGFARGLRHNLHFAARDGELLRCLDAVSLRTQRPDGTGLTVEGISVPLAPNLEAWCRELVRRLDYTGIGCLQFIVDPDTGQAAFLENNPRLAAGYAIAQHCGLDMPLAAVRLAACEPWPDDAGSFTYPSGRRFAWTQGDLGGLRLALRQGDIDRAGAARWLLAALRSAVRADFHLTWRRDDPWPTLALYARAFGIDGRRGGAPSAGI